MLKPPLAPHLDLPVLHIYCGHDSDFLRWPSCLRVWLQCVFTPEDTKLNPYCCVAPGESQRVELPASLVPTCHVVYACSLWGISLKTQFLPSSRIRTILRSNFSLQVSPMGSSCSPALLMSFLGASFLDVTCTDIWFSASVSGQPACCIDSLLEPRIGRAWAFEVIKTKSTQGRGVGMKICTSKERSTHLAALPLDWLCLSAWVIPSVLGIHLVCEDSHGTPFLKLWSLLWYFLLEVMSFHSSTKFKWF